MPRDRAEYADRSNNRRQARSNRGHTPPLPSRTLPSAHLGAMRQDRAEYADLSHNRQQARSNRSSPYANLGAANVGAATSAAAPRKRG